ncbi:MAG: glycogen/starch synthase, ADP-glucose type [Bacteroidetes bacterium]|nr:glycogen/starch synthase, ADP-glucose type [Bacteroidota bacterium]
MARPLNVLLLSSEVEPFAKTGGLADVSSALPKSIKSLDHEVRIMMPRYGSINERTSKLHDMIRLKDIPVPLGNKQILTSVKSSFLANSHSKVQVYFLDNPSLFGRSGLYVHPETQKDYDDNDIRFIFFARGALEVLKRLGWQPDIIHCNDWPTGLVPVYLKTIYKNDPFYKDTKTVFTIHNMAYQGVFPKSSFVNTGLPEKVLGDHGIVSNGKINLLKAGLIFSDAITTVSERYAKEIQSSEEYGCGLQDSVKKRKNDLTGILNGIDYAVWNPSTDEAIPHKYSLKTLDLKLDNKKALLQQIGLPFCDTVPLIGMISRLAEQKGIDIIMDTFDEMMKLPVQLVVLGIGEKRYQDFFEKAQKKYRDRVAAQMVFDENLAHLIEAGSDMFLMASKYEPCGLNQMYSLKYGTVPIVRATGGLDDTVEDFDPSTGSGTGFKFTNYTGEDVLKAVKRAVETFADQTAWRKLIKNGMSKDFSWESSAKKYVHLYRSLAKT